MNDFLTLFGAFILFSGALGMIRFKDPFQRFHPSTKMSLLGFSLILLGQKSEKGFLGILCILFASPFIAHVLSRALYHKRKT